MVSRDDYVIYVYVNSTTLLGHVTELLEASSARQARLVMRGGHAWRVRVK